MVFLWIFSDKRGFRTVCYSPVFKKAQCFPLPEQREADENRSLWYSLGLRREISRLKLYEKHIGIGKSDLKKHIPRVSLDIVWIRHMISGFYIGKVFANKRFFNNFV